MARDPTVLSEALRAYLIEHSLPEHPVLRRLREEAATRPEGVMQTAPEQGRLLHLLVRALGARRVLEVGVYTGYSSLWMALALPPDGRLVALEKDPGWAAEARRHWEEAGVAGRVELRLGDARAGLDALLEEGHAGRFDLAYVDADKESYPLYAECCLALLRPGGLLAVDNVLWGGRVADPAARDPATEGVRALARQLRDDPRWLPVLLPVGDGLALALKLA